MKPKTVITELLLLMGVFIAVWLSIYLYINHVIKTASHHTGLSLEIPLHDTYFVLSGALLVLVPYLFIAVFLYLIKEAFFGYKRKFQNILLLILNLLLLIKLTGFYEMLGMFVHKGNGWTIYPPLSAIPRQLPENPDSGSDIWFVFRCVILFFIFTLMFGTFLAGKNWNYKKS